MSYCPGRPAREHERPEDIGRPDVRSADQEEHDFLSFEAMCRVARQSDRLQALLAKNRWIEVAHEYRLLAASLRKAEAVREEAEDGLTRADRIADGRLTEGDAEWLAGQAEEHRDLGEQR